MSVYLSTYHSPSIAPKGFVSRTSLLLCIGACLFSCNDDRSNPIQEQWKTAFYAPEAGAYLCAWGQETNSVWVVGGQPERGVVWHRQNDAFREVNVPSGALLNWTHGHGDAQWIVGNEGRILHRPTQNAPWRSESSGVDAPLWGVWTPDGDVAFAVGGHPVDTGPPDPIILMRQNGEWTKVPIPETDRVFRALFKVWGTARDNVYAVGARGVVLHYDGVHWTQEVSNTVRDIVSLWGTGPDNILAVGGRSNGMLLAFDGVEWRETILETEPGMNGVWMNSRGEAIVVGERGRTLIVDTESMDYTRDDSITTTLLHGVWGTDAGYRIAVGGSLDRNPPWEGVAVERIARP